MEKCFLRCGNRIFYIKIMSRIGKRPITIPEKTTVSIDNGVISVKGPLGELTRPLSRRVEVSVSGNTVNLSPKGDTIEARALWGTYGAHIANMVKGVNTLFEKKLVIEGIGFKAEVKGDTVNMSLGFSHPVSMKIPAGLKVVVEKGIVTISGINKELVGEFASRFRALKKPEPYKGKGIRYDTEVIRRKQGKKTT